MRLKEANSFSQSALLQPLPSKWPQAWLAISWPSTLASQISPSLSATSSFVCGKTHLGTAGLLARRPVFAARLWRQQEDAGQEIGEARAGPRRQRAAALPLRDVVRAVEGDDDVLRLWCRLPGCRSAVCLLAAACRLDRAGMDRTRADERCGQVHAERDAAGNRAWIPLGDLFRYAAIVAGVGRRLDTAPPNFRPPPSMSAKFR